MDTVRIQNGQTEKIKVSALDNSQVFLTGLTDVLLEIRRKSDGFYYDFNDTTFKNSGWTTRQQAMAELDVTNSPGIYFYDFDTTGLSDNDYYIRASSATASNTPWEGELKVGGYVDNIDTTISSRSSHTQDDIWTSVTRTLTAIGSSGISSEVNATANKDAIITEVNANEAKIDLIKTETDKIAQVLGLVQSNIVISGQTYNANGNLLTATVKTYPTAADADADTNVIKTYTMTATYTAEELLNSYKMLEA